MIKIPEDKYKETYREKYSVLSHDTDVNGRVRASVYLRYMQETANHQMRDCKPTYNELFEDGKAFILSRVHLRIISPLKQYDKICVQTWPSEDKGFTFTRSYRIIRDGEVIAEGLSAWALVDIKNGGFIRCDGKLLENYYHAEKIEGLPLRFPMPRVAFEEVGKREVRYNDADINRHLNNTNYPDILTNFIPDNQDYDLKSMIISYASEAKIGDEMKIFLHSDKSDGEKVNFVRTFVGDRVNVEARFIYRS